MVARGEGMLFVGGEAVALERLRPVLEAILQSLVPKPRSSNEVLSFSVPAAAPGRESSLTYHEASRRQHFPRL